MLSNPLVRPPGNAGTLLPGLRVKPPQMNVSHCQGPQSSPVGRTGPRAALRRTAAEARRRRASPARARARAPRSARGRVPPDPGAPPPPHTHTSRHRRALGRLAGPPTKRPPRWAMRRAAGRARRTRIPSRRRNATDLSGCLGSPGRGDPRRQYILSPSPFFSRPRPSQMLLQLHSGTGLRAGTRVRGGEGAKGVGGQRGWGGKGGGWAKGVGGQRGWGGKGGGGAKGVGGQRGWGGKGGGGAKGVGGQRGWGGKGGGGAKGVGGQRGWGGKGGGGAKGVGGQRGWVGKGGGGAKGVGGQRGWGGKGGYCRLEKAVGRHFSAATSGSRAIGGGQKRLAELTVTTEGPGGGRGLPQVHVWPQK